MQYYIFFCTGYKIFLELTAYRPVSIKRPGLIFFQKSLLIVPYDRKNEGLNIRLSDAGR